MAKGCSNNKYEEARKQRLEENKKRFEDLGISTTAKNLTEVTTPVKKSPNRLHKLKSRTTISEGEPRRSSRVRNPVPSYREDVSLDLPHLRKRSRSRSSPSSWGSYIARPLDEIKEATYEERNRALEAAEALQINLHSSNPSFVKSMVRSHVYSCFWLGLPSRFCEEYLPKTVHNMILEDENGSEYEAVYIGNRAGISGGWRGFALDHKLDDGDALVFELAEPARFKIYIVRAFPDLVKEEDDKNNTSVEEENTRTTKATKASKAANNRRESESNKAKKPKQEAEGSQESLPESITEKKVKPQKKMHKKSHSTIVKNTRSSQRKLQRKSELPESEGEVEIETEKPKAAIKMSSKTRKSKEGSVSEIGDSGNTERLLLENNVVDAAAEAKACEIKEFVEDDDNELKKVELDKKAGKCASQKPRKKSAPKFFRKRA